MRMRILGIVLLTLSLAGCAGTDAPPASGAAPMDGGAGQSDGAVGAIEGQVVDDSFLPVAGVLVVLDGNASVQTGEEGGFTFASVPEGSHELVLSKRAFDTVVTTITVHADATTEVRVELTPVPVDDPYHETLSQVGNSACGFGFRTQEGQRPGYFGLCIALQHAGLDIADKSMHVWHQKLHNVSGFWAETTWEPSTALRGGMNVLWGYILDDGASVNTFATAGAAESPLQVPLPIERLRENLTETPSSFCNPSECEIRSFHSAYGETLPSSSPVDAGLVVNQRYEVWLTSFHNGPLPATFTALPE